MSRVIAAPSEESKLTSRQEAFVREYLIDLNATQAAIRAGYSPHRAHVHGHTLLANRKVAAAIDAAKAKRSARTEITQDRVLTELARLGFSDIRGIFDGAGQLKRPEDLDAATAAAVSSIKVKTVNLGEGEVEYVTEIKLWDKNSALEKIARHLGMLNDKLKIQGDAENPLTLLLNSITGKVIGPARQALNDVAEEASDAS